MRRNGENITVFEAIVAGQLVVNGPVLIIIVLVTLLGAVTIGLELTPIYIIVGSLLGWVWWSFSVPRWRRWAQRRVESIERLQRYSVLTGITRPKGSIFEKTESKIKE